MTRLGDVVISDFFEDDRYLVLGAVVTYVYRNSVPSRVATIPGYVVKQTKDHKFHADG